MFPFLSVKVEENGTLDGITLIIREVLQMGATLLTDTCKVKEGLNGRQER